MNNAMGAGIGGRCFVCLRLFAMWLIGGSAVHDILAGVLCDYRWFVAVDILSCLHLVEVCVRSRGCDFCLPLFATGASAADYICSANFEPLHIRLGLEQYE
jgi:hypothetical protein